MEGIYLSYCVILFVENKIYKIEMKGFILIKFEICDLIV